MGSAPPPEDAEVKALEAKHLAAKHAQKPLRAPRHSPTEGNSAPRLLDVNYEKHFAQSKRCRTAWRAAKGTKGSSAPIAIMIVGSRRRSYG